MLIPSPLERFKWFIFKHFERLLVVLLVASLVTIQFVIDYQMAFLSFYYLPVIAAGFILGQRGGVFSALLIVALTVFMQLTIGLDSDAGFTEESLLTMVPWAGFLILTGHTVGRLAGERVRQTESLRAAYIAMVELLSYHLESSERQQRGHSQRVARLSVRVAEEMGLEQREIETLRIAALLHEIGLDDPRLTRIVGDFPGSEGLPAAGSLQSASALLEEYRDYHDWISRDWPADHIPVSPAAKVLAVADAYETLQSPTPNRPAFAPWTALEEIERGGGQTFGTDVVKALRRATAQQTRRAEAVDDGGDDTPRLAVIS
ncbi:MAG: HD domain-containing protein [Gemmatimonadaceae bacterium]|nr:HD domain-containing protein [Gemmatimonadaceae bacterium]